MRTYNAKPDEVIRKWLLVDAEGMVLGRLASQVAVLLRGKHKPIYTPHVDTGDHVVIVNAAKVVLTGKKATDKFYYRHSGYPGGFRATPYGELMAKRPEDLVRMVVKGMLPHNTLGKLMLRKLKVYGGPEHPHEAQRPEPIELEKK